MRDDDEDEDDDTQENNLTSGKMGDGLQKAHGLKWDGNSQWKVAWKMLENLKKYHRK